jgi:hypothetical protein
MSRRLATAPIAVGALLLVAALALAGCSQAHPSATSTHSTTAHKPTASHTPKPAPTPTFVPANYTCQSILPPATLAVFKGKQADGFALQPDFTDRVHNFDPIRSEFDDFGGILCQWAYSGGSNSVDYGYSPITTTQASTEQDALTASGYTASKKDNGTVLANPDTTDFPDVFLFINGYWMYASQSSLLDLIVENVFSTEGQ